MFGGFLLLGGRAADLLGRKRLFIAGIALFSLASLLNGLAQSSSDADRRARRCRASAARSSPPPRCRSSRRRSPTTRERTQALGVWSAIAAGGGAVGLLLGGVLTDLALVAVDLHRQRPGRRDRARAGAPVRPGVRASRPQHRSFDLAGAVTVTAGLVVLVYAIVKAQAFGWGSARTIGLLAAGARAARRCSC